MQKYDDDPALKKKKKKFPLSFIFCLLVINNNNKNNNNSHSSYNYCLKCICEGAKKKKMSGKNHQSKSYFRKKKKLNKLGCVPGDK